VSSAGTAIMKAGARANSLSFLLVVLIRLVLSASWQGRRLWSIHLSLPDLLRRLPLRNLRLRPVRLCWPSGSLTLFRLLPACRRSARLLHYLGRGRILLPAVDIGRRRIRSFDGS
jgi:hypothetical protein